MARLLHSLIAIALVCAFFVTYVSQARFAGPLLGVEGLLCVMWLAILWARAARTYSTLRRKWAGKCPFCGYDLTGNMSGVCPECGKRIQPLGR